MLDNQKCNADVLIVGAGMSGVAAASGLAQAGRRVMVVDNQLKGISPVPCVTLHASHDFSLANWERGRREVGRELLLAASPWIRSRASEFQTNGWLYSKPLQVHEDACAVLHESPPLVMAGDAFAGPKVEGAALSGWAAANSILGI